MPASSPDRDELLDQLAQEYAERFRRGEQPGLEEYADRYPQLAQDIRELFPALLEMERAKEAHDSATEPAIRRVVPPLQQVGDYRIVREVGRGGMGVVYEAEQVSLGRRVALKVLSAPIVQDPRALVRFQREARAAARLHHTNIVPVFDVGQDGDTFYYAMQFIQGQGLDEVIEEVRRFGAASLPAGVRDGTPRPSTLGSPGRQLAQSLITGRYQPQDPALASPAPDGADPPAEGTGAPAPVVLPGAPDLSNTHSGPRHYFASVAGIGRQVAGALAYAHARGIIHRDIKPSNLLLDVAGVVWVADFGLAKTEDDGLTRTGDIVGTLRYLAPERFRGECDPRADVYALGLTLYELLVLRPAFPATDRLGLIDQIKADEPPRPRALDARIPRDLETIILKAGDKDPTRRYQTAEELAEDLRRFLADEPIRARRASRGERLSRWARRDKGLAASLAVIGLLLLAAALASTAAVFLLRTANEGEHSARVEAEAQRDEFRSHLYVANMGLAQREWINGNSAHVRQLLEDWVPRAPTARDLRGWEWYYLDRLRRSHLRILTGHVSDVNFVTYRPDGAQLASAGDDGTVRIYDVARGQQTQVLTGHQDDVLSLAYSPDGKWLASGGRDRTVRVWDLTGREKPRLLSIFKGRVSSVAFSPDGKRLAIGGDEPTVRLWDWAAGAKPYVFAEPRGGIGCLVFRPDGKSLATAGSDGTVRVWDMAGKEPPRILTGHVGKVYGVAYSPDGNWLASAGDDQTVRMWDVASGIERRILKGHTARVMSVAFGPDGIRLASASIDSTVRIWDAAAGQALRVLRGHTGEVNHLAYSPDGTQLASAGDDETVRVWDAGGVEEPRAIRGPANGISGVVFSPDGSRLAASSYDRTVRVWDVATSRELSILPGHPVGVKMVAYSPDGSQLVSVGHQGMVCLWDAGRGQVIRVYQGPRQEVQCAAMSYDAKWLAVGARDGTLFVWRVDGAGEVRALKGHTERVNGLAFRPDGARLASAGKDDTVRIWDLSEAEPPVVLRGHRGGVTCVVYSPDGTRLVSGDRNGMLRTWDAAAGRAVAALSGHTGRVDCLVFTRDGTRLASGGRDGTVRVWDPVKPAELCVLKNHILDVESVAFSPDGTLLASAGADRTIRIADARPWTAEAADEQEAMGLVAGLFARPLRRAAVVRRVRDHQGITESVRGRALELANRFPDAPDRFHQAAAHLVRYPDLPRVRYQQSFAWVETACVLAPGADYLTTRGIALYRLGRYAEALQTLKQADQLHGGSRPADLAFLAMAHHRLGHAPEARAGLTRLREFLTISLPRSSEETLVFRAEAEALVGTANPTSRK
jgi:WD40 repeat protein/serine/threonine protein kinase